MRTLLRHPGRVGYVVRVLFRYFILPALPFRGPAAPGPVRMRLALEDLGGAWIKLGQMLAMRFDLLPPEYCDELLKLLNQVKPFPYVEVREIIRRELGEHPEVLFASFDPDSFAAASIGQVHGATLRSGERVAVKVQRPDIRSIFRSDISLMYSIGGLVDRTRLFGATKTRTVIDEFARWTADELDYLVEARQAVLLFEHAKGDRLERIARVYRDYSTSRVLTSELIEGVPILEIMVALREGNTDYLDALARRGYDLDRIVEHLDWNMLNQVFVYGYFHADLHPANLFVLPGNAIGYVDYGIIGRLPNDIRESLTHYSWLLFHGEVESAVKELMRWLAPTTSTDPASARAELVRIHQAFIFDMSADTSSRTAALTAVPRRSRENPHSRLAVDTMKSIRDHRLSFSPSVVAFLKMLVMLGTIRHQLATDYDLVANVRRFFRRYTRQRATSLLDPRLAMDRFYETSVRVRRAVAFLEFVESQEAFITDAQASLFGFRRRIHDVRRRLIGLATAVLLVGAVLYVVLADPDGTRRVLPRGVEYTWVHLGLLLLLVLLITSLVTNFRRLDRGD